MISLASKLLLGSKSPRRSEILKLAGFDFDILDIDYEEKIPESTQSPENVPLYLAEQKALHAEKPEGTILITADTLVFLGNQLLGKPRDKNEAFEMLQMLSGKMHKVISGVCIMSDEDKILISDTTKVYFNAFDMKEIEYYIDNFEVLDKAGAYGVQNWIGLIGIEKIEGSYYNVMGLPIDKVYEQLKNFANH